MARVAVALVLALLCTPSRVGCERRVHIRAVGAVEREVRHGDDPRHFVSVGVGGLQVLLKPLELLQTTGLPTRVYRVVPVRR